MPKVVDHESRRIEVAKAVWTVVERDGVNAASVRAVAAECGWTYGMIAHYFKTRDDLLLFAYRLALAREIDIAPSSDDEKDPLKRLLGILRRALPIDDKSQLDVRIWLGFMGRVADDASLARAVVREHEDYHSKVLGLVRECIDAKCVDTRLSAEALMRHIVIYVDGLGVAATLEPDFYDPHALEVALETFLSALGFRVGGVAPDAKRRKGGRATAS